MTLMATLLFAGSVVCGSALVLAVSGFCAWKFCRRHRQENSNISVLPASSGREPEYGSAPEQLPASSIPVLLEPQGTLEEGRLSMSL